MNQVFNMTNAAQTDWLCFFVLDTDIMMVPSTTSAEILEESKLVAQTDGEWELSDVEVVPATLEIADGKYSQIIYHVCCFFFYIFKLILLSKIVLYSVMSKPSDLLGPTSSKGFSFEGKEIVLRLRWELSLGEG